MDITSNPSSARRASLARAILLRVVVWGGVLGLVVLFFGNLRFALPRTAAPQTDAPEPRVDDTGWPQHRGPQGTAIADETDLADSWPSEGPPVLWTRDLGQGYSAFIGVGGRVYTQTQDLSAQSVVCLEADTGRLVWEYRYGWPYEAAGMYPGPRATPTWHAGRIYFASPTGLVGCLRDRDGQLLWSVNVNEQFAGRGTDFGYSCSPLMEDGKLILPVGGSGASVVALSAADGSTVWTSGGEPASYCSAATITLEGRRLVVAFLQNALALFDPATGRLLWQQHYSSGYDEHAAMPLYEEPHLMVAGPFRTGADAYRLQFRPAADGEPAIEAKRVWHSPKLSNDTASSVLIDGYVYGFDLRDVQAKAHRPSRGEFRCLELRTGKVCWSTDRTGHATVIAAAGKLLLFNDKGELLLARISPQGYEELGRTPVFSGEICWTAPALYRGCVYLRSPKRAACVYVGNPANLDQRRRAQARPATQLATPQRLDWTWLVGGEREYAFDLPDAQELRQWYGAAVVGVLGLAALVSALLQWILHRGRVAWARRAGRLAFWGLAFVLGLLATPVFSRLFQTFVFTWPLSLFVTQQMAFGTILWARRRESTARVSLLPLVAGFAVVTVCLSYFQLCRGLGLAPLWLFLLGFLPSWPVAIPAAYRLARRGSLASDLLWTWAGFSLYFASCAAYILWR
jgi:outer membrane protein assembly factor BamB